MTQMRIIGWFVSSCILACVCACGQVDENNNAISDLWEDLYQPIPLPLSADSDGDGLSNREEAVAGTDPSDARSHLNVFRKYDFKASQQTCMRIGWNSVAGKRYHLQYATPDDSVYRTLAGPLYGSGKPMYTWLNTYPFSFGGVHAELWRFLPSDVSQPADLRNTAVAPDLTIGVDALTIALGEPGAYAALRIKGEYRSRESSSGDFKFGLSSAGPSAFYVNPNGIGSAGLQLHATNNQLSPRVQGPTITLPAWKRHAIELVYLPADRDAGIFTVDVQRQDANPSAPYVPEGSGLIPWYDVDRSLLPLLQEPCISFRVAASDYDPDGDGVTTWEEINLGLSPLDPSTIGNTPDMTSAINLLNGGGDNVVELVVGANPPVLIEELGGSATFTLRRLSGNDSLTFPLTLSEVDASDVTGLPANLSLAAGQSSASFTLRAANDGRLEPLEVAKITVSAPGNASINGDDQWLAILEDEVDPQPILYAGRYVQENGPTEAWGYTTLLLSPDRRSALIKSDFSNLTTPQTVAHIHRGAAGVSGPIVIGLPFGTFNDHPWQIGAPVDMNMPGMVVADANLQRVLDDLVAGRLYANVHSTLYPGGEIRANYYPSDGVFEFVPPAPLAPVAGGTNPSDLDAFRFLEQSTFGPDAASMASVKSLGIKEWLARQMNPNSTPPTSFYTFVRAADAYDDRNSGKTYQVAQNNGDHRRNLRGAWWSSAVHGKDQLRQRIAFALSEIFVVSTETTTIRNRTEGMADYYDMLADNAFGNYRQLLEEVTYHPIMGTYLSHLQNAKADPVAGTKPDENYAREIMQLFSIGLFEKHPDGTLRLNQSGDLIPTYNNDDITELAKVFTGLSFSKRFNQGGNNNYFQHYGGPATNQISWVNPMRIFPDFHETEAKTLFAEHEFGAQRRVDIPADQSGDQDIADALDTLFEHPNTPPFISRLLIQRLVTSNPSRGYVYRVANAFRNNGQGVRGDLAAVVEAIYLDQEARLASFYNEPGYGKLKEPAIRFAAVMRAMDVSNQIPLAQLGGDGLPLSRYEAGAPRLPVAEWRTSASLGQTPMHAPSVFNWYLPDFIPGGTLAQARLFGPEFQTTTDSQIMQRLNLFSSLIWYEGGYDVGTLVNNNSAAENLIVGRELEAQNLSVPALVDHLDEVLLGGRMTPEMRNTLLADLPAITYRPVRAAIHFVINSPQYVAQR